MRILIVEDNPDLVENLFDFFEPRGHVLDAAYDGHAGLKFALAGGHDVIVLDVMLPGLDGTTVCTRLRAAGVGVPVLLLTARDTLADKLAGFEAGADDYLLKPFALAELEACRNAFTRRARGEHVRSWLEVADLAFEPDTRQVWRGGRPVELPATPLKILELLRQCSPVSS